MQIRSIIRGLALVATVAIIPTAAFAQTPPPWAQNGRDHRWDNNNNGRWNQNGQHRGWDNNGERRDDRRGDDNDDRRDGDDRGDHRNGNWNGGNDGNYGNRNGNYGYGRNGNYGYGGSGRLGGTVSSFNAYDLYLSGGQHIHLHNGTVINPTGTTLQPGMRLAISGHPNGDGTFEADQIDVLGNNGYGNGYGYGR